jgi:DNA-binding transcriptional LysR family regulator
MEEPMDVTKCNAFLVAVDTGSMTAAAERLGYTQSGVTRMIRSLEEEIGFSLLVRTKKGVVMTENGKNMLAVFRDIVRVHENAEQRSAEIRGVISGTPIALGSPSSSRRMFLYSRRVHDIYNGSSRPGCQR